MGVSPNDYTITEGESSKMMTVLHRGGRQMFTVLLRGGPANDCGITTKVIT